MLENLKEKTVRHKLLAAILFGAIILVFAFFTYQPPGQVGSGYAARVNHQIISVREYRNALEQMIGFYSQMFGGNFDAEAQKQMRVRYYALEQLISREATIQAADKAGIQVSNEEVRDLITGIPAFQENGQFRRDLYNAFLGNRRMSAAQFEAEIKRDIVFNKTKEIFESSLIPSEGELERIKKMSESKLNVEFLRFDTSRLGTKVPVSNEEANKFLATDEGQKRAKEYFEMNRGQFEKDEQIKARHILIKADRSPESDKAALDKVQKLKASLKTTPFEVIAKKESEDLGSKDKGGDLGLFSRGRMVPEFEKAAFALAVGEVSEPVKTEFGYHLIKVEAKQPKTTADFEKEKLAIAQTLIRQAQADKVLAKIEAALSEGKIQAVTQLASSLGVKWEETGSFSLAEETIPRLGEDDALFASVSQLTAPSSVYRRLVNTGQVSYVLRLKSKTVASKNENKKMPVDDKARITSARMRDVFGKWGESILKSSKIERNEALLREEM